MKTSEVMRTYELADGTTRRFYFPRFENFQEIRAYLREQRHANLVTLLQDITACFSLIPDDHPDLPEIIVWRNEARDQVLCRLIDRD